MTDPYSLDPSGYYGVDLRHIPARARTISGTAGDFPVTGSGDLTTVDGPAVVVQSRIKELMTPYGSLGRYLEDVEGVKYINGDYGNPCYLLLSEATTTIPLDRIAEACEYVMLKDLRVATVKVTPDIEPTTGLILVQIDFTLTNGEYGDLTLNLNPSV